MIIEANRSSLLSACQLASQALPTRTPQPIYQNFKVTATGDRITVQATDLEIEVSFFVDGVVIEEEGVAIWPASRLVAILRECDDETVRIDADDRRVKLHTSSGDFEMPGYDPTGFATFNQSGEDGFGVAGDEFTSAINRTVFAASKEEGKYAMRGILLSVDGNKGELVGTDAKRLAVAKFATSVGGWPKVSGIISTKTIKMAAGIAQDAELQVVLSTNSVTFKTDRAVIFSRLVEGNYPPYTSVIPKKHEASVELDCAALLHAVRQASIMTDDESKRVELSFGGDRLTLTAQGASSGKSNVSMPLTGYKGPAIDISFDPAYLTEYLRSCADGERVKLELLDGKRSAVFRGEGYLYLVVPLV
jgi:DNA polymerase-3 subunit beta